jgi:hypothetical protein
MIETEYQYVADISLEEFKNAVVLPFKNAEDGRPAILIRNKREKNVLKTGATDNIEFHLNSVIEKDGQPFYFHVISCVNNDGYSKEQFDFVFRYLFRRINSPMDDEEVSRLISSLQDLFKVSPETDRKDLWIGVYGELLFLYAIHENDYPEIVEKYHHDFFSKHDIELDQKTRVEVKTTVGSKRIHHFKHDQICRTDILVYVASLMLEQAQEGTSLHELFNLVSTFMEDQNDIYSLAKLRGYCAISEDNPGPSFSFEKGLEDLKVFLASKLPHLAKEDVPGVTSIEYDVDCSLAESMSLSDFIADISNK